MTSVNLEDVNVFVAALIAAMLVYFFSSLAIRAVGTTAQAIIVEVRRQFREIPGIMDYTAAGLRPSRRHNDSGRSPRDDAARHRRRGHSDHRRPSARLPGRCGLADGRDDSGVLLATVLTTAAERGTRKEVHRVGHLLDADGNVLARRPTAMPLRVGDTVGDPFKDTAVPRSTSW